MAEENYWLRLRNRSLSRRTALRGAVAGGVGLTLGLAACGGDDDDDDVAEPTSTPTKEEEEKQKEKEEEVKSILWKRTDTTAQATKGGIYQGYTTADVTNLDPLSSPSFTANYAGGWYYPRLLSFKTGHRVPATGEVQGYLGASWEQPDPTTVIFKLQPKAVWDEKLNKRPIDAEDVTFSWNKFAAKGALRKDLAKFAENPNGPVESIEAVDKTTVKFKLAYPYAPFLPAMAFSRYLQIMPRESEGGYDPRNEVRSGGPWLQTDYQRSVKFEYRKNPNYWDADKVFLDGFDFPIIAEYSASLAQFRAKKVWAYVPRQEDVVGVYKDLPGVLIDQGGHTRGVMFQYFGLQPGSPFLDERVRQAASMVMDRDAWIDTFYNIPEFTKEGFPTDVRYHSHIATGWDGTWLDPRGTELGAGAKNFQKNVAEAKKLMEAAGYGNGIDTEIAWITTGQYTTSFPKYAEVFKGFFEESGLFRLKQVNPDYQTEYLPKYWNAKGNFKGIAVGAFNTFPDLDLFLNSYFHTKGSVSHSALLNDAKSDELIDAQRKELDAKKRAEIIKEWQRRVAVTMPMLPWPGQSPAFTFAWPWVGNWGVNRTWEAESARNTNETMIWYDKSKHTG